MRESKLKYKDKPIYMEGSIIGLSEGAVEIDLNGRLGRLKIPMRMLISDNEVKLGQSVGFMLSYPEVID